MLPLVRPLRFTFPSPGLVRLVTAALAVPRRGLHCNGELTTLGAGEINLWIYKGSSGVDGFQSGGGSNNPSIDHFDPCRHTNPDFLMN